VSLSSPLWLLALLVIPLVVLAQRRWAHRARRYAVRFTAVPALLEAIGQTRGRWRQHLPLALILLAIAVGVLALSRPQISHRVAVGNGQIMLVLDHSGSMAATDVSPTRIAAAITAGNTFIDELPSNVRVGFVGFGFSPDAVQRPTAQHAITKNLLDEQEANGGTDTGPALQLALQELDASKKGHAPAAIVLLSDGAANLGVSPVTVAQQAKTDHVPIYTVALGTADGVLDYGFGQYQPVPPDPQLMRAIATTSGGKAFDAQTSDQLSSIYKDLGDKLGSVKRERDITIWVVLVAALLLLLGAAASVRTAVRLP
jgi:Ca-activated chloride channel family protein